MSEMVWQIPLLDKPTKSGVMTSDFGSIIAV